MILMLLDIGFGTVLANLDFSSKKPSNTFMKLLVMYVWSWHNCAIGPGQDSDVIYSDSSPRALMGCLDESWAPLVEMIEMMLGEMPILVG